MVLPLREIPGRSANIWNSPMMMASSQPNSRRSFRPLTARSPATKRIAVPIKNIAADIGLPNIFSSLSSIVNPATAAGIDPTIMYQASRDSELANGCRSLNPTQNALPIA
jgi:hypothetical protein